MSKWNETVLVQKHLSSLPFEEIEALVCLCHSDILNAFRLYASWLTYVEERDAGVAVQEYDWVRKNRKFKDEAKVLLNQFFNNDHDLVCATTVSKLSNRDFIVIIANYSPLPIFTGE